MISDVAGAGSFQKQKINTSNNIHTNQAEIAVESDTFVSVRNEEKQSQIEDSGISKDTLLKQKLNEKDKIIKDIDVKINDLREELKTHEDHNSKLQNYSDKILIWGIGPMLYSFLGTIVGGAIALKFGVVIPVTPIMGALVGIGLVEAITGFVIQKKSNNERGTIRLLNERSQTLAEEKASVEKERQGILDVKNMVNNVEDASSSLKIIDQDEYVEINGMKIEKKQLHLLKLISIA